MTGIQVKPARVAELARSFPTWPSWNLTARQLCDLELLLNGGFAPLSGYDMCRTDYESCLEYMRLSDGTLWPIPVLLDVPEPVARDLAPGLSLILRDLEGVPLAVLHVRDVWRPDLDREARAIYGTTSVSHPAVQRLMERTDRWNVGGDVEGIRLPHHYDFVNLRHTPADIRRETAPPRLERRGRVSDTPTDSSGGIRDDASIHREGRRRAVAPSDCRDGTACRFRLLHACSLLSARVQAIPGRRSHVMSLLPLATRMAGLREVILAGHNRKNHGCTHIIVCQDDPETGMEQGYPPTQPKRGISWIGARQRSALRCCRPVTLWMGPTARRMSRFPRWPKSPKKISPDGSCGIHHLLHRPVRRREVDGLQPCPYKAPLSGVAGASLFLDGDLVRRHLSSELGILTRAPGHEYPTDRFRGLRNHQRSGASPSAPPSRHMMRFAARSGRR